MAAKNAKEEKGSTTKDIMNSDRAGRLMNNSMQRMKTKPLDDQRLRELNRLNDNGLVYGTSQYEMAYNIARGGNFRKV